MLFRDARSMYMPAENAVVSVKKVTYFGGFCHLNSHCMRRSINLMFEFLKKMNTLVVNDTGVVTDVSVGFQPPRWCPSGWTLTGRLHKKLCKGRTIRCMNFFKPTCLQDFFPTHFIFYNLSTIKVRFMS